MAEEDLFTELTPKAETKISLSTTFKFTTTENSQQYASINLINGLSITQININENKTEKGHYTLSYNNSGSVWSEQNAGIAVIVKLLNRINDDFLIKEKFTSNAPEGCFLQFYIFENILQNNSIDDIKKIGKTILIPHVVNVISNKNLIDFSKTEKADTYPIQYVKKTKPQGSADGGKNIDCQVKYITKQTTHIFFKSFETNTDNYFVYKKRIAVFYSLPDYEGITQLIIPKSECSTNSKNDIYVTYCSDWAVYTSGNKTDTPIHAQANSIAKNLAEYLGISEQLIRSFNFIQLYELCRSSS